MGARRLIDNAIKVKMEALKACQSGAYTTAQAQQMFDGVFAVGDYKGYAAILDLDALVKQPLVLAEQLHILGILDGREEDYDLQTVTIPLGTVAAASVFGQLTVPSDEVWYVNDVRMTLPADQGGSPTANWHCSLWTDRAVTPSAYGQPFHAAGVNFTPGGGVQDDEFSPPANWWAAGNKPVLLRLPGGAVLTMVVVNAGAVATAAMASTLQVFGFVGKPLVD